LQEAKNTYANQKKKKRKLVAQNNRWNLDTKIERIDLKFRYLYKERNGQPKMSRSANLRIAVNGDGPHKGRKGPGVNHPFVCSRRKGKCRKSAE